MNDAVMKKSQSIKSLNTRLQKFAIEDVEIPKRKDRSSSVMEAENNFKGVCQNQNLQNAPGQVSGGARGSAIIQSNSSDQLLFVNNVNNVYSKHDQEGYEVFPSNNLGPKSKNTEIQSNQNQQSQQHSSQQNINQNNLSSFDEQNYQSNLLIQHQPDHQQFQPSQLQPQQNNNSVPTLQQQLAAINASIKPSVNPTNITTSTTIPSTIGNVSSRNNNMSHFLKQQNLYNSQNSQNNQKSSQQTTNSQGVQNSKEKREEFVKLISKDGKEFIVPVRILKHSPTFARMLGSAFNESKLVFSQ